MGYCTPSTALEGTGESSHVAFCPREEHMGVGWGPFWDGQDRGRVVAVPGGAIGWNTREVTKEGESSQPIDGLTSRNPTVGSAQMLPSKAGTAREWWISGDHINSTSSAFYVFWD